jgi:hypothetical protein
MSSFPTPAEALAPAPMNAFARLGGVLFNPKETFADIARKPSFVAPLALLMVLGIAFAWMMNQRVDWPNYIRQQAEKNPRFAQLSEEQKQQAIAPQTRYAPTFAYAIGALGSPLAALIMSGVFMLALNLGAGAQIRFPQAFGAVSHGFMPSAIASVLGIVIMSLKSFGDVDPENIIASHAAAFLDNEAPRWMVSLGSSFELFWIWVLALFAIGFSAINPKKLSTGKAAGIIFGVWLLWVVVKVGFAAAFS